MDTLVIVTGGSAGLGRALLDTAPDGARRVDVSRSGHPEVPEVRHVAADLADPASWPSVGDAIAEEVTGRDWQRVTVIHAAGVLEPIGFAGEVDTDAYTRNVLLNSAATQVIGHLALAPMRGLDTRCELVMLSSGAARTAYPGWSSYGAAKAATDHWVRCVAAERAHRDGHIRVLSVAPGVVATGMQEFIRSTSEHDFPPVERFHRLHAEGHLEDPDDVARRLWRLLDADPPIAGPVVDLRDHR